MTQPDEAARDPDEDNSHEPQNVADHTKAAAGGEPGTPDKNAVPDSHAAHDGAGPDKRIEPVMSMTVTPPERDIEPFLAAAEERIEPPHEDRPFTSKLLDYSAHAAMIIGLLGFAWTLSAHTGKQPAPPAPKVAAVAAPEAPPSAMASAELHADTQKMAADISALRLSLEAVRSSMHADTQRQDKAIDQLKVLAANLESLKTGLSATKTETSAALTQLSGKIDHLQHAEAITKLQQVSDRLDKLEHETADQLVTASVPASAAKSAAVAVPPVRPQMAKAEPADLAKTGEPAKPADSAKKTAAQDDAAKKPPVLPDWVVREVDNGVAIVESRRGQMAVEMGATIPGAGVVKSIERHGGAWTVTTSKGQLAYVPLREQTVPLREQTPRDYPRYYREGPEDY